MIAAQRRTVSIRPARAGGIDDVRIGINLASSATPDRIGDAAVTAIRDGVDTLWTNQMPGGWDAFALLAGLGRGVADAGVELGTAVVPTYPRHPVVTATEAATITAVTGAPLVLGLGPSHAWIMTEQLGLEYASPAAHTREYLEIVRALLRGEHVRQHGRFYTVDTELAVPLGPPPTLLLSALGPRMLAVARDVADGTIGLWVRPSLVADHLVPALGDGARVVVGVPAAVTTDPDGVREQAARDFAGIGEMPAYRAVLDRGGLSGPADTVVAGSEEEVARELRAYAEAGATDLQIIPLGPEPDRVLAVARDVRDGVAV